MTQPGYNITWSAPQRAQTIAEAFRSTNQGVTTPLMEAFFSPKNMKYITDQVEKNLDCGDSKFHVPLSNELVTKMFEIAQSFIGSDLSQLHRLNLSAIAYETDVQRPSNNQRNLYYKYFIANDRMKVYPRPVQTRITRGETSLSFTGNMLTYPDRKNHDDYLDQVLHIRNKPYAQWPPQEFGTCMSVSNVGLGAVHPPQGC